jgi:thiol-disulfide isomerase/thioredoxin
MKLKNIFIVIMSVALLAVGCSNKKTTESPKAEEKMEKKAEKSATKEEKSEMMKESETMGSKEMMQKKEAMKKEMENEPRYTDYSEDQIKDANSDGKKVVLFFHASWCPNCKQADAEFKTNISKIPEGIVVLKTDYDTYKDLKKKYGVTYQHTFVQIDKNGEMVTKWIGGGTEELVKNTK